MKVSLSGVFADAGAMWRQHRDILSAVGGVFFVVPFLAMVLLMAQSGLAAEPDPAKLSEALQKFYADNVLVLLLCNVMMDFGTAAVLILLLQPGERTLGETLALTLRRLLPFVAINVIGRILFGIGSSLFLLPGLFVLGRTWLAAPAFAAQPGQGLLGAFRQGWERSGGVRWLVLLGSAAAAVLAAVSLFLLGSILLGLLARLVGDSPWLAMIGLVLIALIGGMLWMALALIRVAAYRATEPSTGI